MASGAVTRRADPALPWAVCPGIHGRSNCPCLAQDPKSTDGEADPAPSDIERMITVQSHS